MDCITLDSRKLPLVSKRLPTHHGVHFTSVDRTAGNVETPLVISQRRRIDPTSSFHRPHVKLASPSHGMAYKLPIHQVGAVIDGESGKVLER